VTSCVRLPLLDARVPPERVVVRIYGMCALWLDRLGALGGRLLHAGVGWMAGRAGQLANAGALYQRVVEPFNRRCLCDW
jgi:hypothetical protein